MSEIVKVVKKKDKIKKSPKTPRVTKSEIERFAGKYTINDINGCWIWNASTSSQGKYPTIGMQGSSKPQYAHKIAYESKFGPVPTTLPPDGSFRWELHHQCFEISGRSCINPDHIICITSKEHSRIHQRIKQKRREKVLEEVRIQKENDRKKILEKFNNLDVLLNKVERTEAHKYISKKVKNLSGN